MMREIKFRGMNLCGKWVYGDLTHNRMCMPDGKLKEYISVCGEPIFPKSVGQFTGLKDCKGQEIYEGDVLRDPDGRTLEVVWNNGAGSWECAHEDYHFLFIMRYIDVMTVIGNVHDNPELLEVEA